MSMRLPPSEQCFKQVPNETQLILGFEVSLNYYMKLKRLQTVGQKYKLSALYVAGFANRKNWEK